MARRQQQHLNPASQQRRVRVRKQLQVRLKAACSPTSRRALGHSAAVICRRRMPSPRPSITLTCRYVCTCTMHNNLSWLMRVYSKIRCCGTPQHTGSKLMRGCCSKSWQSMISLVVEALHPHDPNTKLCYTRGFPYCHVICSHCYVRICRTDQLYA